LFVFTFFLFSRTIWHVRYGPVLKRVLDIERCVVATARVLASQAEAIVRTGKHGHNIE